MVDREQQQALISELRKRMATLPPLEDEPQFATCDDTLTRYLTARDWKLPEAERMLINSIEYRRRTRPLHVDCAWCHTTPGFHAMRQVGHDLSGRPVIYNNFAQAAMRKAGLEDSIAHSTYVIENAERSMAPGVSSWVYIYDCTGLTLSVCNPKLGYDVLSVFCDHYPERMGLVLGVNHGAIMHGVWMAIKPFVHPKTAAKVKPLFSKRATENIFSKIFSEELKSWLYEEIALNMQKPLPIAQVEFWKPPSSDRQHDPRGCPSYVREYVDTFPKRQSNCTVQSSLGDEVATPSVYKPHPNIVDQLQGLCGTAEYVSREVEEDREREDSS